MASPAYKIYEQICEILEQKKDFTGQINVEIHLKEGMVKDVYVTNRSKVSG